ncbi:hypothetical protein DV735_g2936, partial [Chaetothyriales sp. CBS 134920]
MPAVKAVNLSSIAAELPDLPAEKISANPWDLTNGLPFSTTRLQEAFGQMSEQPVTVEPSETLLHGSYPYQELSMFQFQDPSWSPPSASSSSWPAQQTSPIFTSESSYAGDSSSDSTPWSGSSRTSSSITGQVETGLAIGEVEAAPQLHRGARESCFTISCSLLQSLKRPSSQTCIFESGQPPSPQSQQADSTIDSVDKILFSTDRAVEHVACVIQCSCHTMSSVRCALALTLFEVISWYETIIHALNRTRGPEASATCPSAANKEYHDGSDGANSSKSSPAPHESAGPEASAPVSIPAVSVGTLQLQQTEVNSVLTCLMRTRIGKVRGMIESLSVESTRHLLDMDRLDSLMELCLDDGAHME